MAKEPWEEDIYEEGEKLTRSGKKPMVWANRILTILAAIFLVIVIGIVVAIVYLSSGGSSSSTAREGFYSTDVVATPVDSAPAPVAESTTEEGEEETSTSSSGPGTVAVLAGEGEAAIAARAGISIAQLEALNPEHMTTGAWFANAGDIVKTQ